jgi:hypothetical protein
MILIGFAGKKQAGKDSCCNFLVRNCLEVFPPFGPWFPPLPRKVYYGKPMKDFAEKYLGIPNNRLWGTDDQKNTLTSIKKNDLFNSINYDDEEYATVREVLQWVGEDSPMYRCRPRIWLDFMDEEIEEKRKTSNILLCGDIRKKEQVEHWQNHGGIVFHLLRDIYKNDTHKSEIDLDNYKNDAIIPIDNRSLTIEETNRAVVNSLRNLGIAK